MKADLHNHTHFSDGTQSAAYLIERAVENGVTHLAITDHDCVEALSDLPSSPVKIIPGVEISSQWENLEVHIVGLFVNTENPILVNLLELQQKRRSNRASAMGQRLAELGEPGLVSHLEDLPCVSYTRSHMADFLVEKKISKTRQKAFKTHLAKGGKIYVAPEWCELKETINAIKESGGIAVLAHPGRYPLNKTKLGRLVKEFKALGGDGIEGSYPNIAQPMQQLLESMANEHDLYLSLGSDFHDPAAHWTDVGKFPPLSKSGSLRAVWHHPRFS